MNGSDLQSILSALCGVSATRVKFKNSEIELELDFIAPSVSKEDMDVKEPSVGFHFATFEKP